MATNFRHICWNRNYQGGFFLSKNRSLSERMADLEHKASGIFASLDMDIQNLETAEDKDKLIDDIEKTTGKFRYLQLMHLLRSLFAGDKLSGDKNAKIGTLDSILKVIESANQRLCSCEENALSSEIASATSELCSYLGLDLSGGFYQPDYEFAVDLYLKALDEDFGRSWERRIVLCHTEISFREWLERVEQKIRSVDQVVKRIEESNPDY